MITSFFNKTGEVVCNNTETCTITSASGPDECGSDPANPLFKLKSGEHPVSITASQREIDGYSHFLCMTCFIHANLTVKSVLNITQAPILCGGEIVNTTMPELLVNAILEDPPKIVPLNDKFEVISLNPTIVAEECPIIEYKMFKDINGTKPDEDKRYKVTQPAIDPATGLQVTTNSKLEIEFTEALDHQTVYFQALSAGLVG